MEFIKYAAIEYTDPKTGDIEIFTGYDHNAAYDFAACSLDLYLRCKPECCREGYFTSNRSFKDREEALIIAKNAGQLKPMYDDPNIDYLNSYMLKKDYQKCI